MSNDAKSRREHGIAHEMDRCVHFTGIMDDTCKAGVAYRKANLPLNYVHDIRHGFAYLLLPWRRGWLAFLPATKTDPFGRFIVRGARLNIVRAFHNCTATGVY